jgi:hypothetical protein
MTYRRNTELTAAGESRSTSFRGALLFAATTAIENLEESSRNG